MRTGWFRYAADQRAAAVRRWLNRKTIPIAPFRLADDEDHRLCHFRRFFRCLSFQLRRTQSPTKDSNSGFLRAPSCPLWLSLVVQARGVEQGILVHLRALSELCVKGFETRRARWSRRGREDLNLRTSLSPVWSKPSPG